MNHKIFLKIMLLLSCAASLTILCGQNIGFAQEDASMREQRREILPVEKLRLFLESPERIEKMQPERVIEALGIKEGEYIADIGAGTGFFSFRLADRVGADGRVYAVEIEDELLEYIRTKMLKDGVTNIVPVKSSDPDPNLSRACCDKILVINTYYYLSDPIIFMTNTRRALKPGGQLVIIGMDPAKKARPQRGFFSTGSGPAVSDIIDQMQSIGFVFRGSHDFLESRFILVFDTGK